MPAIFELTVLASFAAAHQLPDHPSKCRHLHGHTWNVEVTVSGDKLDGSGMLLDFSVLKGHVRDVAKELDHCLLNDLAAFDTNTSEHTPTAENIARHIFSEVRQRLTGEYERVRLTKVRVWESPTSAVTYREDD